MSPSTSPKRTSAVAPFTACRLIAARRCCTVSMDFRYARTRLTFLPGEKTTVAIDGKRRGGLVPKLLGHSREIAMEEFVDGLFVYAEWKRLDGYRAGAD